MQNICGEKEYKWDNFTQKVIVFSLGFFLFPFLEKLQYTYLIWGKVIYIYFHFFFFPLVFF